MRHRECRTGGGIFDDEHRGAGIKSGPVWFHTRKRSGSIPEDRCGSLPEDHPGSIPEDRCGSIPEDRYGSIPEDRCGSIPEDGLAPYQKTRLALTRLAPYQKTRRRDWLDTRRPDWLDTRRPVWLHTRRRSGTIAGGDRTNCGGMGHPVEHSCMRQVSSRRRRTLEPILRKTELQEEEKQKQKSQIRVCTHGRFGILQKQASGE